MSVDSKQIPGHLAVIMDGNGRWAKARGLKRISGHHEGIKSVREIVEVSAEIGIKQLTLYTFSFENWERPDTEVKALMSLLMNTISKEINQLHKNNIQVRTLGILDDLPVGPRDGMLKAIEKTKSNTGLVLSLALSYGSRQEIVRSVNSLIAEGHKSVDETQISSRLFNSDLPDPDLLIRTGGEYRISNFLLWQLAYAEIYVCNTPWPEFRRKDLLEAVEEFSRRERRFGKISEQIK
jgi:undecaprenyl diphosphate synthase